MSSPNVSDSQAAAEPPLIEEMLEAMSLSMLVFLLADVRLMSQTGRISLPFEWIAVDSDYLPRCSKARLAGLDSSFEVPPECQNEGLSTAQIMACLLLELEKSVKSNREDKERAKNVSEATQRSAIDLGLKHDEFTHFEPDPTAPPEKENMHSLLRVYAEMIGRDLNALVPHIEARRSVLSLVGSSRQITQSTKPKPPPLSPIAEEESDVDDTNEASEVDEQFFGKIEFGELAAKRLDQLRFSRPTISQEKLQGRINELRKDVVMDKEGRTQKAFQEVTDAVFKMADADPMMSRRLHNSIINCGGMEEGTVSLDPDQVRQIMEKAVASRVYKRLDFMSQFFRKGTISHVLSKGSAKVVYFNDWFPLKEMTYSIAVDVSKKRVYVVFRGAITNQDWKKAFNFKLQPVPNPIKGESHPKQIHIYAGFYSYLFRVRKDTGTTKYHEIASLAHTYGIEKIGEDYSLVVCGHSLGAALSTVFAFHVSAEDQFTQNGPVKVFTFGSPYVGGHDFGDMFRYQEIQKKIQYGRFYNHNGMFIYFSQYCCNPIIISNQIFVLSRILEIPRYLRTYSHLPVPNSQRFQVSACRYRGQG